MLEEATILPAGCDVRQHELCTLKPAIMKRSRFFSGLCAILALTAWVNTQAMVCCWHSFVPKTVTAKTGAASGHECCEHASNAAALSAIGSLPAGVAVVSSPACGNCGQYNAPALGCYVHPLDLTLVRQIQLPGQILQAPSHFLSAVPFKDSGPLPFLAFRRLLI